MRTENRDIVTIYELLDNLNKTGTLTEEQKILLEERIREMKYKR